MDSQFSALQKRALRDPEAMHGLLVASLRRGLLSKEDLECLWAMGMGPRKLSFQRGTTSWITNIAGVVVEAAGSISDLSFEREEDGFYHLLQLPLRLLNRNRTAETYYGPADFDTSILLCRTLQNIMNNGLNTQQTGYETITPNTERIRQFQNKIDSLLDELQERGSDELVLETFRGISGRDLTRWNQLRNEGSRVNMLDDDSEDGSNELLPYVAQGVVSYGDAVLGIQHRRIAYAEFDVVMAVLPNIELPEHLLNSRGLPRNSEAMFILRDRVWDPMVTWFLEYRGVLA